MIPIYQPYLPESSLEYAHDAIDSTWISSQGKYKEKVVEKLKELLGVKYILLLNSGTAASHLLSRALMNFYPSIKNIIVPNNVYVAAWNGFLFDNYYKLIPIDSNIHTWSMDFIKLPDKVDINTTAFLAVHNVCGVVNVPQIKRKYENIIVVEDACEGFLGKYEEKNVGTDSLCSALSFFGNKNITCGEGGALLTNNKDLYDFVNKLHGQGQSNIRYIHDELGYNYRMTNIQAAVLYGQLEILPEIIEMKQKVFDTYREMISTIPFVEIQSTELNTKSPNWMMGIRILDNPYGYNHVEEFFKENGVEVRPMFYPMSSHKYIDKYINNPYNEVISPILSKECLMLPSYPELKYEDIEKICDVLRSYIVSYIDN